MFTDAWGGGGVGGGAEGVSEGKGSLSASHYPDPMSAGLGRAPLVCCKGG